MSSYRRIIKATGLMSFTQFVIVLIAVVRTKLMAIWLGPSGFGVYSLYTSVVDMIGMLSGLGLEKSGVRQIALAVGSGNRKRASKSLFVLRRAVLITSIMASLLTLIFSNYISVMVFATQDKMWEIASLSLVFLFTGISAGQKAILNGYRDIKGLARCQIMGSILGAITTIIIIYYLRNEGIAISLIIVAMFGVFSTWVYSKKIKVEDVALDKKEVLEELKNLLKLGIAFWMASLLAAIAHYIIRVYIRKKLGIEWVGIYHAGWAISNLYVGTILSAMSVDFLPSVSKYLNDNGKINKLANDQMEIGLLIATIGVLAGLIFAPTVLHVFYSEKFKIGDAMIRWQFLGVGLHVLGFPIGYILLAKAKGLIYLSLQGFLQVTNLLFLITAINFVGIKGLGFDYFLSYIIYVLVAVYVCRYVTEFTCSSLLIRIIIISLFIQFITAIVTFLLPIYLSLPIGILILIISIFWILRVLIRDMDINLFGIILKKIRG